METRIATSPLSQRELESMLKMYEESMRNTALYEEYFRTSTREFGRSLRKPGTVCIVQFAEGEIIGFIQGFKVLADQELNGFLDGYKIHSQCHGEYFFIERIAVRSEFQNQDIGEKLIEQILGAPTCGRTLVWANTGSYMFELITKCGGKMLWSTQRVGYLMEISARE